MPCKKQTQLCPPPTTELNSKSGKPFADALKDKVAIESNSAANKLALASSLTEVSSAAFQLPPGNTTPTTPVTQMTLSTPLTHAAWSDEFSQQITWMASQRNQNAELHLNPPNLGPLDVVLNMNGDQATILFTSPHAAVREAIEQAMPKLREMLADSGIMLGNAMVSDQSAQKNQDNDPRKSSSRTTPTEQSSEALSVGTTAGATRQQHRGIVDTFA